MNLLLGRILVISLCNIMLFDNIAMADDPPAPPGLPPLELPSLPSLPLSPTRDLKPHALPAPPPAPTQAILPAPPPPVVAPKTNNPAPVAVEAVAPTPPLPSLPPLEIPSVTDALDKNLTLPPDDQPKEEVVKAAPLPIETPIPTEAPIPLTKPEPVISTTTPLPTHMDMILTPPPAIVTSTQPKKIVVLPDENPNLAKEPAEQSHLTKKNKQDKTEDLPVPATDETRQDIIPEDKTLAAETPEEAREKAKAKKKITRAFGVRPTVDELLKLDYKFQIMPDKLTSSTSRENSSLPKPIYHAQLDKITFRTIKENNLNALRAMIESNHELNIVNSDHASLLIYATSLNNIDAVRLLVAKKINLDEVDKNGVTALHIAVQNGYKNIAALLVSMGARSDVKDTQGKSSAELANQQDDTEVKRLIPTKSIKAIFPPTKLPILQKKS